MPEATFWNIELYCITFPSSLKWHKSIPRARLERRFLSTLMTQMRPISTTMEGHYSMSLAEGVFNHCIALVLVLPILLRAHGWSHMLFLVLLTIRLVQIIISSATANRKSRYSSWHGYSVCLCLLISQGFNRCKCHCWWPKVGWLLRGQRRLCCAQPLLGRDHPAWRYGGKWQNAAMMHSLSGYLSCSYPSFTQCK